MDWFNNFWAVYSNLVLTLGTNALLALSIYLTLSCGMLAMANAAFMGIGAYTAALLTMNYETSFAVSLAGGMAAPAIVAFIIGKPTLRLSHRPTAEWLQAHGDLDAFKAAALAGARGAAEDRVRLWFGWHLLHEIIDPATVTAAEILDRIERPFSRDRLAAGLARLEAGQRDLAIAA